MGMYLPSPTSDKVGYCLDHSKYQYDSNNDMMPDTNYPNCGLLTLLGDHNASPTMPTVFWGAADLGCVTTTLAGLAQGKPVPRSTVKVKMDLPRPLFHRAMGAN
jgi:hypothetical protein